MRSPAALGTTSLQAELSQSAVPSTSQQSQGQCPRVVVDAKGETIIGANVKVKGSTIGLATDIDGRFSFGGVKPRAVIEVSFVGYM